MTSSLAFDRAAFESAISDLNRRALDDQQLVLRTPGGPDAYPLLAPIRTYALVGEASGRAALTVRTAVHGPITLLWVMPSPGSELRLDVAVPDPGMCARPEAVGEVITGLDASLGQLARKRELTPADRAVLLGPIIDRAAILLLDADAVERDALIAEAMSTVRDPHGVLPSPQYSYHAGAPGLGRRA